MAIEQVMNESSVMPQAPEAEKVVLGTLLSDSNTLNDVRDVLPVVRGWENPSYWIHMIFIV